jgi:WD40 repeat protein
MKTVGQFPAQKAGVCSLAWSPDGFFLISGGIDRNVCEWVAATGELLYAYEGRGSAAWSVACSPDGTQIAAGYSDGEVWVWERLSREVCATLVHAHDTCVRAVAWSPDGTQIASGALDRQVIVWNASTGSRASTCACQGMVRAISYSPDGRRFATGGSAAVVQVWDAATGKLLVSHGCDWPVNALAWSPDSTAIAVAGVGSPIYILNADDMTELKVYGELGSAEKHSVAWSTQGLLATGDYAGWVWVWDPRSPSSTALHVLQGQPYGSITRALAWTPSGRRLASGGDGGQVSLWGFETALKGV